MHTATPLPFDAPTPSMAFPAITEPRGEAEIVPRLMGLKDKARANGKKLDQLSALVDSVLRQSLHRRGGE